MIWVRLIGGPANGQVKKIDEGQMQIRLSQRQPAAVTPRLSLAAMSAVTTLATYTRRSVRSPEGEVIYFAEEGLSDLEALQTVLGP